jgi:hypothetical protein
MSDEKNGTGTAIFPTSEIIQIERVEDIISIAQRRENIIDKLMTLALKRTNERDWMSVEGGPYIGHSGAEKVARLFGIKLYNIQTVKEWSEDSKGRFYIYKTTGASALPGGFDSIEALGTCSQRDKFFAWTNGAWKDTAEIDETNIMKASYSNFVVNAITHLLGLRNLTWEDLKGVGIDPSKVQKVEYQKGSQKSELSESGKALRTKLGNMLLQMAGNDKAAAKSLLEKYSRWVDAEKKEHKADDLSKMSEKWIASTYGKAKADFDKTSGGPVDQGRDPGAEG